MHQDGISFLEECKKRALEKIAFLTDPADEAAFRSWITAITARYPSVDRVQKSRGMEHAEIVVDSMIEYHRWRESKVQALQREVDRLDMVISGEKEFMNSMKALAWCRE
ncbi:MAG: hypothetical protein EOM03_17405 [Clostridia bacterium]|nr:hypothetical protein [Clostridia bacterium]